MSEDRPRFRTVQLDDQRELETIVLTQVRDSLALINTNLAKLDDNVRALSDVVMEFRGARYDDQIDEMKRNFETYRTAQEALRAQSEARFIEHDRQLVRFGLGMAIATAIGASAMTGVIALAVARIFGAH